MAFDRSIIDTFARGGELLRASVAGLTREDFLAYPVPGTWSIQEIVVHMMDSDGIGIDRMKRIIAEELPLVLGYNETLYIQRLHPATQSLGQVIAVFDLNRRLFARVLEKLTDADFDRCCIHNEVGKKSLAKMLEGYVEHLDHHLGYIRKKRELVTARSASAQTLASDAQLLATYAADPQAVNAAIAGLSADELGAKPVEGMWSTQEVIIHLADADTAFAHRLKRIIAEDDPSYDGWSENAFVRNLNYGVQSAVDAAAMIEFTHRQMMRIFNSLTPGWLDRRGIHSERGQQTARNVLEYATWHVSHHLKFVKDKRRLLGKPLVD